MGGGSSKIVSKNRGPLGRLRTTALGCRLGKQTPTDTTYPLSTPRCDEGCLGEGIQNTRHQRKRVTIPDGDLEPATGK